MKAWLIDNFDGIPNARLTDVPDAVPGTGEALMKVKLAGLNPADAYLALAQYPAKPVLPHVLGRDGMGEIVSVGAGVPSSLVGQKQSILRGEVGVSRWGTFAELVAVPVESLVHVPEGWTDEESAGAALVYLTAFQALTQWADLPAQSVTLITGASGGVGVASTQLAIAMGHTVIGLSRNPAKRERLTDLGMHLSLDPADANWRKSLASFLGKRKVDLAIDNVGGALFPEVIATLGNHGRVSVVGRLAGEVPSFNTASLFFKRLRIGGVSVGAYTHDESRAAWKSVLELLHKTGAKPLVDHVLPFEHLPQAFEKLSAGPMGKVLVRI